MRLGFTSRVIIAVSAMFGTALYMVTMLDDTGSNGRQRPISQPKDVAKHEHKVIADTTPIPRQPPPTHRPTPSSSTQVARKNGVPPKFQVRFTTTKGDMVWESELAWAPLGVTRLYELVDSGFFNANENGGIGMFRCVKNFVIQFGIHGTPSLASKWGSKKIKDDTVILSNAPKTMSFASAGKDTRTSQLFFNIHDNKFLDKMAFAPISKCVEGCDILDKIEMKYGEQPNQGKIQLKGNEYLKELFPDLDYITKAVILMV